RNNGAAGKRDQIGHVAAVERQFENPLILDHLADAYASCFNQRGIGLNLNLLADLSNFEDRIYHRRGIYLQNNSRLHERTEARYRRFQAIGPRAEMRQHVAACFVRYSRPRDTRVCLCGSYFHTRQYRTALIPGRAADLRSCLRPDTPATENHNEDSK